MKEEQNLAGWMAYAVFCVAGLTHDIFVLGVAIFCLILAGVIRE